MSRSNGDRVDVELWGIVGGGKCSSSISYTLDGKQINSITHDELNMSRRKMLAHSSLKVAQINKPYVSHAHHNHEISIAHISKTCKSSQANA